MFHRCVSECRLPMFGLEGNEKNIDLKETLEPSCSSIVKRRICIAYKFAMLALTWCAMVQSIYDESPDRASWIIFLTHWCTLISTLYLMSSLISMVGPYQFSVQTGTLESPKFAKWTWGLFAMSIHCQLFVTILFWYLVYDGGTIMFKTWYEHGVLFVIVAIDGFFIHRFPLRFKHIFLVYLLDISYLVWTGIHSTTNIGNTNNSDNDPETDDDALYGVLNWNQRPQASAILAVVLVFVVVPVLFLFLWIVSACIPRRYIETTELPEDEEEMQERRV